MRNLRYALKDKVEFVDSADECDIYFLSGATMVERDEVKQAQKNGKKFILRVDNTPRNSRNRNSGTSRLYDYAQMADWVVFQSHWAKDKIMPLVNAEVKEISNEYNEFIYGKDGKKTFEEKRSSIIYNGVNTNVFKPDGVSLSKKEDVRYYMINRFNRDNNKRLEEALDIYTDIYRENKNVMLRLIGHFSSKLIDGHFDFYLGEPWEVLNVAETQEDMAIAYRSCDELIYPSYSDACPNVVLEADACGLEINHHGHGGIPEILAEDFDKSLTRMGDEYYNLFKTL